MLYSLGKVSYRMLARIFGVTSGTIHNWDVEAANSLAEISVPDDVTEMEFAEMWHYTGKKRKSWVIKAVDSTTNRMVAWVLGKRNQATFKQLYDKVKHLINCTFYTDAREIFAKVLPKSRHIIGKAHTRSIELNGSNTHHHLGSFTRKTKIVSKSEKAVDLSLKL